MTTIGMIVPPADGAVPPEPPVLYPDLRFIARGLALPELTPEGYDSVIDHVADLARQLKDEGADAVSLMGTSLSFYRGPEGNAQVLAAMREATALPVTTMTDSVLEALAAFGAKRIAVATAYTDVVNDRLRSYLGAEGLEILSLEALSLTDVKTIQSVGDADLITLGKRAAKAAPEAEALFISCGGLRTLPVITPLEDALGVPVISSATAGAWGAVRLSGHPGRARGYGRLFEL
ncbi:aspartate/glutamate racemase family protein [Aestuariivita boseongensis]|uniref:arylmalonate decarboxylase n=1 Tax=Aestuariivita boseongensis TaxID=1470562 RepID=UPI000680DFAD|nr:aspartate/glutamate racemase family protein [Aestuariivita boseongensis]